MLIVLSGLPGSGKSTIARELARKLDACWLRIDSIEQAIRASGVIAGSLADAGYRAAYAIAEDNLRLGRIIIGDCVNDCALSRNAWRDAGRRANARVVEIEIICSAQEEHLRRVETRTADIPGHVLPTWADVSTRDYHKWDRDVLIIDTAGMSVAACVARLLVSM